jgi:hypothetical protein
MNSWSERLEGLWRALLRRRAHSAVFPLHDVGFHGDDYLLLLVNELMPLIGAFVETGTNVGTTARYVAKTYPGIPVYSCEPDLGAFAAARRNLADCPNVRLYNMKSPGFLHLIHRQHPFLKTAANLYFLDAHGHGFKWPLREELTFITATLDAAYVLIDDFKVPGLDCFGYDKYDGQECSFDYVKSALNPKLTYSLYYPSYTERTSPHHPLRGWGLIEFGHGDTFIVSDYLRDRVDVLRGASPACRASGA